MTFTVTSRLQKFAFRAEPATVWRLENAVAGCAVEIAVEMGCNCYQWQINSAGQRLHLLYADPEVFPGGRPTRSGVPILFPFPNRMRDGRFTWEGKTYQGPLTDSTGKHAIHGFACRHAWRVINHGGDGQAAWLTAEFQPSIDAPQVQSAWPADYRLGLTFRLTSTRLRLEASVENTDRSTLPFGLGYHPYFHLESPDSPVVAPARSYWELRENLPTGQRLAIDAARDLRAPRPARELQLDDVFTDLPSDRVNAEGLVCRGRVGRVELWTSVTFRELVAFTPPHRQAVCLEPYTCTTDAANLQARGVDAGWQSLAPGQRWSSAFEMVALGA
jgi:aldose 1-epimerase